MTDPPGRYETHDHISSFKSVQSNRSSQITKFDLLDAKFEKRFKDLETSITSTIDAILDQLSLQDCQRHPTKVTATISTQIEDLRFELSDLKQSAKNIFTEYRRRVQDCQRHSTELKASSLLSDDVITISLSDDVEDKSSDTRIVPTQRLSSPELILVPTEVKTSSQFVILSTEAKKLPIKLAIAVPAEDKSPEVDSSPPQILLAETNHFPSLAQQKCVSHPFNDTSSNHLSSDPPALQSSHVIHDVTKSLVSQA